MPTFCRHNRFIERCPICNKTLPGNEPSASQTRTKASPPRARSPSGRTGRVNTRSAHGGGLRVHREARAADDGYRSELVAGLRSSEDALRLAEELAFARGRLLALAERPPGLYGEARKLADAGELERASWTCLVTSYVCPLVGDEPWAGIGSVLDAAPSLDLAEQATTALEQAPLGPRSSHERGRGAATLIAYREWVRRSVGLSEAERQADGQARAGLAGVQARALTGDHSWSAERRFERLFERLVLPGFSRAARYELLTMLGYLGMYELTPDSLHLGGGLGAGTEDATTLAAKRVFGIGDPMLLERRAAALAQAVSVPIETLDLALFNWAAPQIATLGVARELSDSSAFEHAGAALRL